MARKDDSLSQIQTYKFEEIVLLVKDLIEKQTIRVKISLPGEAILLFEINELEPTLTAKGIDTNEFGSKIAVISAILTSILVGQEKSLIEFLVDKKKEETKGREFDTAREKKVIREQFKTVEKELITESLLKQLAIKRTAKSGIFRNLSWEINEKHADGSNIQPQQFYYTTLRLEIQKTPVVLTYRLAVDLSEPERVETTVFDASPEDIDELQLILSRIKKRLVELETKGG
jgi:hypothetical protein